MEYFKDLMMVATDALIIFVVMMVLMALVGFIKSEAQLAIRYWRRRFKIKRSVLKVYQYGARRENEFYYYEAYELQPNMLDEASSKRHWIIEVIKPVEDQALSTIDFPLIVTLKYHEATEEFIEFMHVKRPGMKIERY